MFSFDENVPDLNGWLVAYRHTCQRPMWRPCRWRDRAADCWRPCLWHRFWPCDSGGEQSVSQIWNYSRARQRLAYAISNWLGRPAFVRNELAKNLTSNSNSLLNTNLTFLMHVFSITMKSPLGSMRFIDMGPLHERCMIFFWIRAF